MKIISLLLFSSIAFAQVLPDAPSATLPREYFDGTNTWHQLQELPDAPSKKPGIWTVGRWDAPHPLRTNRETLRSWTFWGGEVANWGSAFAEVQVTRNERQNPPIPRHGELYFDAFVPALAVTGMHYVADRFICRGVGLLGVAFASAWRGYSAVKGYYE